MEFAPTENQQLIAQTVKDFAEKHIRPNVMKWDGRRISCGSI